ncbi:EXON0 [Chrysodeixis includens nucleopolyhedrovirus]|uniref:EXON0 n=1 Tax=Chrysodeixis includens nucleopolyhedrovirus TaxID=1207438 RepID=A0A5B8YQY7_9ABAC|nr:EXON0 [Chrysodeixis includens nucleopolyhedrovirus]QED40537.1 EXON0 [Chrysodeixis includens nucleopolyhedrovirus]
MTGTLSGLVCAAPLCYGLGQYKRTERIMELQNAIASILMSPKNFVDEEYLSIEGELNIKKQPTCTDVETQVYKNFILAELHTPNLALNSAASFNIKKAAFDVLNTVFKQKYNRSIDTLLVLSEEKLVSLPTDRCLHFLIAEISKIIDTIHQLNTLPQFQDNIYIFLPYIKQLQTTIVLFKHDLCCKKIVENNSKQLTELICESEKYIDIIRSINKRIEVMNVYLDKIIYTCNICQESSNEKQFLKPNECCGYQMCNLCYSKLWKFAPLYAVCPVCKTSFKTSNVSANNKIQTQRQSIFPDN